MLKTTQTEHQSRAKAIRDEKRCINSLILQSPCLWLTLS